MQKNPDMSKLIQLAQSPAGKQLISKLQQSGGQELQSAMTKASAGDYGDAKQALSELLKDPELQVLLKQLGGTL